MQKEKAFCSKGSRDNGLRTPPDVLGMFASQSPSLRITRYIQSTVKLLTNQINRKTPLNYKETPMDLSRNHQHSSANDLPSKFGTQKNQSRRPRCRSKFSAGRDRDGEASPGVQTIRNDRRRNANRGRSKPRTSDSTGGSYQTRTSKSPEENAIDFSIK